MLVMIRGLHRYYGADQRFITVFLLAPSAFPVVSAPTLRTERDGWGTRFAVVLAEGWANRPSVAVARR